MQNNFRGGNVSFTWTRTAPELSSLFSEGSWMSQFVPCGSAGAAGLRRVPGDLPRLCSLRTETPPVPCLSRPSSATALQRLKAFTHPSSREPGILHAPPQEVRGLVYTLTAKNSSLGLNMHCNSQESRIHLFWESSFKSFDISKRLHCCSSWLWLRSWLGQETVSTKA